MVTLLFPPTHPGPPPQQDTGFPRTGVCLLGGDSQHLPDSARARRQPEARVMQCWLGLRESDLRRPHSKHILLGPPFQVCLGAKEGSGGLCLWSAAPSWPVLCGDWDSTMSLANSPLSPCGLSAQSLQVQSEPVSSFLRTLLTYCFLASSVLGTGASQAPGHSEVICFVQPWEWMVALPPARGGEARRPSPLGALM